MTCPKRPHVGPAWFAGAGGGDELPEAIAAELDLAEGVRPAHRLRARYRQRLRGRSPAP
jgi:hypothetical protein